MTDRAQPPAAPDSPPPGRDGGGACREWRRVLRDLPVTFVWAYDTAAILDDHDDSEPGVLPAGQLISFAEVTENPGHCLCDLDDPAWVEKVALPCGRVMRWRPWCFATRLQAVLEAEHFHTLTTAAVRPSRWRRLVRGIKRGWRSVCVCRGLRSGRF